MRDRKKETAITGGAFFLQKYKTMTKKMLYLLQKSLRYISLQKNRQMNLPIEKSYMFIAL